MNSSSYGHWWLFDLLHRPLPSTIAYSSKLSPSYFTHGTVTLHRRSGYAEVSSPPHRAGAAVAPQRCYSPCTRRCAYLPFNCRYGDGLCAQWICKFPLALARWQRRDRISSACDPWRWTSGDLLKIVPTFFFSLLIM